MSIAPQRAFGAHIRPGSVAFDSLVEKAAAEQTRAPNAAQAAHENHMWLRYSNQGAVRNQPISSRLKEAMSFLPEKGITMEVFSGGQPGSGSGKPRVGSERHDHGNSADVFFYKDGRKLDWSRREDVPIFQDIVRTAKARGVTGFGAGPGYMQQGSMHIGFGAPAVWGAGGRGANAPQWLRDAFGGPAGFASDVSKDVLVNQATGAANQTLHPAEEMAGRNLPITPSAVAPQTSPLQAFINETEQLRGLAGQGRMAVGVGISAPASGQHQRSTAPSRIAASAQAIAPLVTY